MTLSVSAAHAAVAQLSAAFAFIQRDLLQASEQLHQLQARVGRSHTPAGCGNGTGVSSHHGSSAGGYPHPSPMAPPHRPSTPGTPSGGHGTPCPTPANWFHEDVHGQLEAAVEGARLALVAAEGVWEGLQRFIGEGQQRAADVAMETNNNHNRLIANTLSIDAIAVQVTSYLSVKDQCRTQLVSKALAAVVRGLPSRPNSHLATKTQPSTPPTQPNPRPLTPSTLPRSFAPSPFSPIPLQTTRSLRALTECTVLGTMPPPVCTFVMRCLPNLRSLHLKRTSAAAAAATPAPFGPPTSPQLAPACTLCQACAPCRGPFRLLGVGNE
jgi:hypothetical protein